MVSGHYTQVALPLGKAHGFR